MTNSDEPKPHIDIEYAVFATVHHAYFTKQEHDIHGDVSKIVESLLGSLKANQSSTAYLLSVRVNGSYVYLSNAKKRQLNLWRRSQSQLA